MLTFFINVKGSFVFPRSGLPPMINNAQSDRFILVFLLEFGFG